MEDLSHMISPETGLTGGESMNAANMTSGKPDSLMQAPGSAPLLPPVKADNPVLDIPGETGPTVLINSSGKKVGDSYGGR